MKNKIKWIILTVFVIIVSLFVILNVFVGIENIRDRMTNYSSGGYDSAYMWAFDDKDYMRLLGKRLEDKANGHEVDEEYAAFEAAADYYYAAVLYKAFMKTGDADGAARQKAAMDEARAAMGSESAYADEIDAFLEKQ